VAFWPDLGMFRLHSPDVDCLENVAGSPFAAPKRAGREPAPLGNQTGVRFVFGLVIAAHGLFGQAVNWKIDPLHSSAQFSVRHMMISTVRGQFGGVKGNIVYDPKNPTVATVEATIDCSTVNTGEAKRDADLKGAEFFDVKKYPVMTFKSKRVEVAGEGKLKMTGDLTINAVTRSVVLDLEGPTAPIKDTQGRMKIGISGETKISRKEFGILYNPILESGGVTVSDEVKIILEIELIKN
jgi:polyisoprenoid-binding protein YceI